MIWAYVLSFIAGFVGVFYIAKCLIEFIRYRILFWRLPGPKQYLIFGNIFDLICDDETFFKRIRKWSRDYSPVFNLSTGLIPTVNISAPEEFELVASSMKNVQKGEVYKFMGKWLGEGLLTSTGTKWKIRRKILTPAFHFGILQEFVKVFNRETDRLVEMLKKQTHQPYVNVVPLISQFTLYTITETAMGSTLDMDNNEDKNYVSAIVQIGKIFFHRLVRPYTYINTIFYSLFPLGYKEKRLINTMHNFTDKIISERSENFEKFDESSNYSQRKKLAMLDLLLEAKTKDQVIDDEGIRDEVTTFMFEGHDTTSMSICFTLMLLAYHKDAQNRVYQEMISVVDSSVKHPSLNDFQELKYMERFIKESLRLYPSVPFIARTLDDEVNTKHYILPKGAQAHIHIFDIHRDPKHWPDPEKFDPERFLPENCINRHPFSYVPFSAGPRNCIGQKYAILEVKAVLFGILQNFILDPVDTPESIILVPDIILRTAKESLKVKFRPRQ